MTIKELKEKTRELLDKGTTKEGKEKVIEEYQKALQNAKDNMNQEMCDILNENINGTKDIMDTMTTEVKHNQEYYILPKEYFKIERLEMFNTKKDKWRKEDFEICIMPKKQLKTDKELKIYIKLN